MNQANDSLSEKIRKIRHDFNEVVYVLEIALDSQGKREERANILDALEDRSRKLFGEIERLISGARHE